MRETCLLCVSKHIAQAIVLVTEARLGYPLHLWFAVGHLAEAEAESVLEYPQLAEEIRSVRICLMGQHRFESNDLVDLLIHVRTVCAAYNSYSEENRVSGILSGRELPENYESTDNS